ATIRITNREPAGSAGDKRIGIPDARSSFSRSIRLLRPLDHLTAHVEIETDTGSERAAIIRGIALYALTALLGTICFLSVAFWINARYVVPIRRMTDILGNILVSRAHRGRARSLREGDELRLLNDAVWQLIETLDVSERSLDQNMQLASDEISATRARFNSIADSASLAVCSIALPAGALDYATRTLLDVLQLHDRPPLHWRELYRTIPRQARQTLAKCVRETWVRKSSSCHLQLGRPHRNRIFFVRLNLVKTSRGDDRLDCIAFDDTARATAENALNLSESRKAAIIDGAIDGFVTVDVHGAITEINPAAERMFRRFRDELLGVSLIDQCIAPGSRSGFAAFMAGQLLGARPSPLHSRRFRSRGRRKDVEEFPFEAVCTAVEIEGGVELCLYLHDLTETQAQEHAIRVQTEKLGAIFALSPDGFAYFNGLGYLTAYNPALLKLFDFSCDDMRGMTWSVFWDRAMKHARPGTVVPEHDHTSETGEAVFEIQRDRHVVLKFAWRQRDLGDGDIVRIYYFRDITRESELDRMKTDFLATAAHELRTPVTVILGFTELLLRDDPGRDEALELLSNVRDQARWLKSLLNDLLDLVRIESQGAESMRLHDVDIGDLVRAVVKRLAHQRQGKLYVDGIEVQLKTDTDVVCSADPEKVQQALNNLISNAVNYSDGRGPIEIEVRVCAGESSGYARIAVKDQGIGMIDDELARVFDRFWRANTSGSRRGTGLGLSLVKEIAEQHGGRATLESRGKGLGTTASIMLPLPPSS
ncbi:MAG TPA: PAS domain-containing sensor histidine kinase, partial [Burkholderiales bacterium]